VDSALRLILLLRETPDIGVTDAARHLGVAPSTAHRLIAMLCLYGFAERRADRRYGRGPALMGTGLAAHPDRDLVETARPYLQSLCAELNETVHLMVLQGTTVRFVDGVEARQALRVGTRTGMVLPAHTTSGGKALLAQLSRAELTRRYAPGLPHGYGPAADDLAALRRQLAAVRRRGYAVNQEESERGIVGVGVRLPVSDAPLAALVVGVPSVRCPNPRIHAIGTALLSVTVRMPVELG
jgi:DNA-binding IclR family transcriptional regulator